MIRDFDWAKTSLGSIAEWPQSLRTVVDLMLAAGQPAYIAWGPELISLYNDGYIPILGTKHPQALGRSYAAVFPEILAEFRPIIEATMDGNPQHFIDRPVPLSGRPGRPISWFTFSWTPLRDDSGEVAGFYCVATETTEHVQTEEARLRQALNLAELGTWSWDLANRRGEIDARAAEIVGIEPGDVTDDVRSQFSRVHPADREHLYAAFRAGIAEGGEFTLNYRVVLADGTVSYVASRVRVIEDEAGHPVRLLGTKQDMTTERAAAAVLEEQEERQAFLLELSDALRDLTDPVRMQADAARLLGEHLQADRVFYADVSVEDGIESLTITREFLSPSTESLAGQHPVDAFGEALVMSWHSGRVHVVSDRGQLDDTAGRGFESLDTGAFIGVPLVKEGRLLAGFAVHQRRRRTWTAAEVALVTEVAERTWTATERARAEGALRDAEERYLALFNAIDQGFCTIEVSFSADGKPIDYRFLEVSPSFERQTGIEDAVGRWMREIIPDQDEHWFEIYGRVALTGEPSRMESYSTPLERWWEVYAFRIQDPSLRRVGVLFHDITERKRVEATLLASEARFRSFADASADTLWIVGADTGNMEYLSPAFERTWGESREAVLNNLGRWADLVHPDDREHSSQSLSRVFNGERILVEYRIVRPSDGDIRWIRDDGFPLRDAAGRIRGAGGIARDVTDEKRVERERQTFAEGASHDLRTPLAAVKGQAQLMLRRLRRGRNLEPAALELGLTRVVEATSRMESLIDEMLDAAHLGVGRTLDLHTGRVDLVALVEAIADEFARTARKHRIQVEAGVPALIGEWDGARLMRVFGNLIGNAVKYSPGGGDVVVRLDRDDDGPSTIVSVRDRGIGIPAEDMQHLFTRYRRGGNVARIHGSGIGLAGARQIVEQHGGTITAVSEEGEGATFTVRLPLTPSWPEGASTD